MYVQNPAITLSKAAFPQPTGGFKSVYVGIKKKGECKGGLTQFLSPPRGSGSPCWFIMNARKSLYDIKSFYSKKAVLKASFQGMRYQIEQAESDDGPVLRATIWPEPFCFEKTPEKKKVSEEFDYSEEGLDAVYEWLCQSYTQWDSVCGANSVLL